jgi:hypothetical protein
MGMMMRLIGKRSGALFGAMIMSAWLVVSPPVAAQPSPFGLDEAQLVERDLSSFETEHLRVHHSAGADEAARAYADVLNDAAGWLADEVGWNATLVVAVLDGEDWRALARLPFPVPHARPGETMVVIPTSIAPYPGFDVWNLDARELTTALAVHELGHVASYDLDINRESLWVGELVANLFMAGYVRARRPELDALLGGVPDGFDGAGEVRSLAVLDEQYAGVGLENYAWFQFRLAELADAMVKERPFAEIVSGLRREFPFGQAAEEMTATLARLERIVPGSTQVIGDMTGE